MGSGDLIADVQEMRYLGSHLDVAERIAIRLLNPMYVLAILRRNDVHVKTPISAGHRYKVSANQRARTLMSRYAPRPSETVPTIGQMGRRSCYPVGHTSMWMVPGGPQGVCNRLGTHGGNVGTGARRSPSSIPHHKAGSRINFCGSPRPGRCDPLVGK